MDNTDAGTKHGTLQLITFIEKNVHLVYSPDLDLCGYGNNKTEATQSFGVVLEEYLKHTTKEQTLEQDLKKHGWQIDNHNKTLVEKSLKQLLGAFKSNESAKDLTTNIRSSRNFNRIIEPL